MNNSTPLLVFFIVTKLSPEGDEWYQQFCLIFLKINLTVYNYF